MLERSENQLPGRVVLELPVKYREIIILYYYKELKIDEIAHLLSVSDNTVKTRLRRGREKLRDQLKGGEWHDEFSSEASN